MKKTNSIIIIKKVKKNMKKKQIVFVGLVMATALILGSMTTLAATSPSVKQENDSPLYEVRTQNAINSDPPQVEIVDSIKGDLSDEQLNLAQSADSQGILSRQSEAEYASLMGALISEGFECFGGIGGLLIHALCWMYEHASEDGDYLCVTNIIPTCIDQVSCGLCPPTCAYTGGCETTGPPEETCGNGCMSYDP